MICPPILFIGHSDNDPGAVRGNMREHNVVKKEFGWRLWYSLCSIGVPVMLADTRPFRGITDKATFAACAGTRLAIDLHLNASDKATASGLWFCRQADHSEQEAKLAEAMTAEARDTWPHGVKDYTLPIERSGLGKHMSKHHIHSLVVEIGFLSNDDEIADLVSNADRRMGHLALIMAPSLRTFSCQ